MSITFGRGIRLGQGITVAPSFAPPLQLTFDPTYLGTNLGLEWSDLSCYANGPENGIALVNESMVQGYKYVMSYTLTYITDPHQGIGIANRNVNLNNYLGNDTDSLGYYTDGNVYYNGVAIATGLSTWGTIGDIVELAFDTGAQLIWFRVNGGNWNNNPSADPVTGSNGISVVTAGLLYNCVCYVTQFGPTEMMINGATPYTVPSDYRLITSPYPSFAMTSARATNPGSFDGQFANVTTNGYTLNADSDSYAAYYVTIVGDASDMINAQTAANMTSGSGYMWYTSWGPGSNYEGNSNYTGGVSHVSYNLSGQNQLFIVAFNTNSQWSTPGNYGNAAAGTYQFPVVCTAIIPTIIKNGYC